VLQGRIKNDTIGNCILGFSPRSAAQAAGGLFVFENKQISRYERSNQERFAY